MKVNKSFKTELKPNNKQKTLFEQYAGTARFSYNWALNLLKENKDIKPSAITLHKLLIKKKNDDCLWMKTISKWCPQNSLRNLEIAYKRFFKKKSKFPQFKKKGKQDSFTLNEPIYIFNNFIKIPKIGKVRLKETDYLPEGNPKSITISKRANRWFCSIQYETEIKPVNINDDTIGVDLGIKSLATCSDGETFTHNKNKINKLEKTRIRLQRKLCRQQKGSKSREKTKVKISKNYFKSSNIKKDILHKTTSKLVKTKLAKTIVIEDLNVSGMMKNHNLAKAISNVGMYEFRRQLEYKCKWYGKKLIVADRFFPSSKMINSTGEINDNLKLSNRKIKLPDGSLIDRDFNASLNLRDYGINMSSTLRYSGIDAGGDKRFMSKDKCLSEETRNKHQI